MATIIELHCHLLPGVDDGAATLEEAGAAIATMVGQGVSEIVVTPHVEASSLRQPTRVRELEEVLRAAWEALLASVRPDFPELLLHRGAELMLDDPHPELSLEWVRLAGTRFVLLEFPAMSIPLRATEALASLVDAGYTPVVAHPERYVNAADSGVAAESWREVGARLQVNSGSLLGRYGPQAARRARTLLERGWVDYLASDYHARGRLSLEDCRRTFAEEGFPEHSDLLLCTNPARLLMGLDPLPVAPLPPRENVWKRLVRRSRLWSG